MKALLKTGEWVDIDTNCLFDNQYNTTEEYGNRRIFDGQIKKIVDDVRLGLGKCKYCGAIVKRGEEEKHFLEMEEKKKLCSMDDVETKSCFWKQRKFLGETEVKHESRTEIVDGVAKTIDIRTMEQKWVPYCSHEEHHGGCTHDKHRKHGIKWFTPDNCYFLRYPNGTDDYTMEDWLSHSWEQKNPFVFVYIPYIGSYTLEVTLKEDQKTIDRFLLSNARNHVSFTYDTETELYSIYDGIEHSPRTSKNVLPTGINHPKCNEKVNWTVKIVVTNVYENAKKVV